MRAVTAALGIGAVLLATGASAQTINDRLKAVEKKTSYFALKRITKTKTWSHVRSKRTRSNGQLAEIDYPIPIAGSDPIIVNAWVTVSGDFTFTPGGPSDLLVFALHVTGATPASTDPTAWLANSGVWCQNEKGFAASDSLDVKVFCQGTVNPGVNENFVATLVFGTNQGAFTVNNLSVTLHLVTQVITEPPE